MTAITTTTLEQFQTPAASRVLKCMNAQIEEARFDLLIRVHTLSQETFDMDTYIQFLLKTPDFLPVVSQLTYFGEIGKDEQGNDLNLNSCVTNTVALALLCEGHEQATRLFRILEKFSENDFNTFNVSELHKEIAEHFNDEHENFYFFMMGNKDTTDHCFAVKQKGTHFEVYQSFVKLYPLIRTHSLTGEKFNQYLDNLNLLVSSNAEDQKSIASKLFLVEGFLLSENSGIRYVRAPFDTKTAVTHLQNAVAENVVRYATRLMYKRKPE